MKLESVNDAARRYGVTPRAVQKWIKSGRIEGAIMVGNSYAIPVTSEDDAERIVQSSEWSCPLPLVNGCFCKGESKAYVDSIPDAVLRDIATAELYYFSGENRRAASIFFLAA